MNYPIFYKPLLWATGLTAGMLLVWIGLNNWLSSSVWMGMRISQSALTGEYCEFNHPTCFFHQPINTYSNLAYFFFGVLVLQIAGEDAKNQETSGLNRLESFPLLSVVMGGCFLYLSVGSAFFHASLTYVGQRVDMNATYSILLTLVAIALYHVRYRLPLTSAQKKRWVVSLLALIILFFQVALWVPSSRLVPAFILLLNGLMITQYVQSRNERSIWLIIVGFVLVVIAIKIRTLDVQKIGCDPYSFFQGHALWHVLTALSSFCSYSFFRFTLKPQRAHDQR